MNKKQTQALSIKIIPLFSTEEKEMVNNTIADAICRAGYDLNTFDWDILGEDLTNE